MADSVQETVLELPNESIKKSIKQIVHDHGFESYDIKISPGSNKGDNYVGIVYRVNVTGTKKNGEEGRLDLICKLPPTNAARRKEFRIKECFKMEVLLYDEILPKLMQLQEKKGISDGKFEASAECCATNLGDVEEYIIMKDLRLEGYAMFDRFSVLDFDHAKLVMEALGKFHAFSFALRDQEPEYLEQYKGLQDAFFTNFEDHQRNYFIGLFDEVLKLFDEHDVDIKNKIVRIRDTFEEIIIDCVSGQRNEPYSVITHGDCWNNNMLFKYENGKPTKVKLLDWQICRYSTPVLDLMYYIYCCTVKSFRDKHYQDLLNVYHSSLSKYLTQLGSDPEELFPYSVFQEQLKKFGVFGFLMSISLVKIITSNAEDTPDLDALSEKVQDNPEEAYANFDYENTKDAYNTRIFDVINDMNKLGYLD